jgi:hypothetical protein
LVAQLQPSTVSAEAPWISPTNYQTGLELAYLSGQIGRILAQMVPVTFLDVAAWRSAIGVVNKKSAVLSHLRNLLVMQGVDVQAMGEHATEAFGLALALVRRGTQGVR